MLVEDTRINDVLQGIEMNPFETEECRQLLIRVIEVLQYGDYHFSNEQWLALGNHLLGVIRRMKQSETLPQLEASMMEQISADSKQISYTILRYLFLNNTREIDQMEVFLLAVHFEGAKTER